MTRVAQFEALLAELRAGLADLDDDDPPSQHAGSLLAADYAACRARERGYRALCVRVVARLARALEGEA